MGIWLRVWTSSWGARLTSRRCCSIFVRRSILLRRRLSCKGLRLSIFTSCIRVPSVSPVSSTITTTSSKSYKYLSHNPDARYLPWSLRIFPQRTFLSLRNNDLNLHFLPPLSLDLRRAKLPQSIIQPKLPSSAIRLAYQEATRSHFL
jgi:hypothetical protein